MQTQSLHIRTTLMAEHVVYAVCMLIPKYNFNTYKFYLDLIHVDIILGPACFFGVDAVDTVSDET